MQLTISIPDDIAGRLGATLELLTREALESLAVSAYRSGRISQRDVGELLGLSWHETEAFLKMRQAELGYSADDLADDLATMRKWRSGM